MPKVRFDVTDVDPGAGGDWGGNGHQPKPGIVNAEVVRVTPRKKNRKGADLERPDIEWVFNVLATPGRAEAELEDGAWLGLYTQATLRDNSFSLANVLEALEVVTATRRKGDFDTDKMVGKQVRLKINADEYQGNYKASVGRVLPPSKAADGGSTSKATAADDSTTAGGSEDDEPPF